ncbi:MAG TPA: hypothetical protein VGA33_03580 [Thermoanaerobaculia bacterium]
MKKRDIHDHYDFFEFVRVGDSAPPADRNRLDVAILDMNHSWPNLGHDGIVHAILDAAEISRAALVEAGAKVRALSFDVRRRGILPAPPDGQFKLYVGTGGPGHLDPRQNDGLSWFSQGVREEPTWEAPLFRLFDAVVSHPKAALIGICHSFGLMCRWSGAARPVLREEKSSGIPTNVLAEGAVEHPWFSRFAGELPDHRHYRVIDNRLFDLILDETCGASCLAFESENSAAVTMLEFARDASGVMPRVFGMNHHPEIIDRDHVLSVLEEKRAHGEVTELWHRERADTMTALLQGENERQSRVTSEYTFLGPLRHYISILIAERCGDHSYQISIS